MLLIRCGSLGLRFPYFDVKIKDPDAKGLGEIVTNGRHMSLGYLWEEDKTNELIDTPVTWDILMRMDFSSYTEERRRLLSLQVGRMWLQFLLKMLSKKKESFVDCQGTIGNI